MRRREFNVKLVSGRRVAFISLGSNSDRVCVLYLDDYISLIELGVSTNWSCTKPGNAVAFNSIDMKPLGIARILLDAKAGQAVRYLDGNPLNLRRENLSLVPDGKAKSCDRARISKLANAGRTQLTDCLG
jgi:hypothetical protein